jgi:hypothetical protein
MVPGGKWHSDRHFCFLRDVWPDVTEPSHGVTSVLSVARQQRCARGTSRGWMVSCGHVKVTSQTNMLWKQTQCVETHKWIVQDCVSAALCLQRRHVAIRTQTLFARWSWQLRKADPQETRKNTQWIYTRWPSNITSRQGKAYRILAAPLAYRVDSLSNPGSVWSWC